MNNLGIYASMTATLLLVSMVASNVLSDPYNMYVTVTGVSLFSISFVLLMKEMNKRNREYGEIQNEWRAYLKGQDKNNDNLLNEIIKKSLAQNVTLELVLENIKKQSESNHEDIKTLLQELKNVKEENIDKFRTLDNTLNELLSANVKSKEDIIESLRSGHSSIIKSLEQRLDTFSSVYEEKNQALLNAFVENNQKAILDNIDLMVKKNMAAMQSMENNCKVVCDILKNAVGEATNSILSNTMQCINAHNKTVEQFLSDVHDKMSQNQKQISDAGKCVKNMDAAIEDLVKKQATYIDKMSKTLQQHVQSQTEILDNIAKKLSAEIKPVIVENMEDLLNDIDGTFGDDGSFKTAMDESLKLLKDDFEYNINELRDMQKKCLNDIKNEMVTLPNLLSEENNKILLSMAEIFNEQKSLTKALKKWNEDREKLNKEDYDLLWSVLKK